MFGDLGLIVLIVQQKNEKFRIKNRWIVTEDNEPKEITLNGRKPGIELHIKKGNRE